MGFATTAETAAKGRRIDDSCIVKRSVWSWMAAKERVQKVQDRQASVCVEELKPRFYEEKINYISLPYRPPDSFSINDWLGLMCLVESSSQTLVRVDAM